MTGSIRRFAGTAATAALVLTLGACSVNVEKGANGEEKKVDIKTPLGSLNVNSEKVTAKDTGFPVYPGAKEKEQTPHHEGKAAVNIDTPMFGLKVAAMTFTSPDSPEKVLGYYRDQIKSSYGKFVECKESAHTSNNHHGKDDLDKPVSCDGQIEVNDNELNTDDPHAITLRAGTNGNQHVVAVKPKDGGTEFSLVYVRVHGGKEDSI